VSTVSRPREQRPPLALIAGGLSRASDAGSRHAPAQLDAAAQAFDRSAQQLAVWSQLCREQAARYRSEAAERRAARPVTSVAGASNAQASRPVDRVALERDLRVEEHEGALGQFAMFDSPLGLGQDDADVRQRDAERHAAQVDDAVEQVARDHGPLSGDERRLLSGLADRQARTAARLDLDDRLVDMLMRMRESSST
jgi:transposase-like protein